MSHLGADPSAQIVELASLHNEMHRFPYLQAKRSSKQSRAAAAPRTDHQPGPTTSRRLQMEAQIPSAYTRGRRPDRGSKDRPVSNP